LIENRAVGGDQDLALDSRQPILGNYGERGDGERISEGPGY